MSGDQTLIVVDPRKFVDRVTRIPGSIYDAVARVVERLSIELQAHVKDDKLSGQVLHVRTGTLRRSINRKVEKQPGFIKATVGTNVSYGKVHEYGFNGTETVKAHVRLLKQAWGKSLKTPVEAHVRSYARNVNFPERSFLRSALADMNAKISSEIKTAASGELNK